MTTEELYYTFKAYLRVSNEWRKLAQETEIDVIKKSAEMRAEENYCLSEMYRMKWLERQ